MIYAATEGRRTLIVEQDDDPANPRKDCNPFGRMICWHRRYSLGDDHGFNSPEDFLRDLYRRSIQDGGKRLVSFLKSGKARGSRLEYNRHTHEWDLYSRSYWKTILGNSEPDWYLEQSAPKSQLNDSGWFFDSMLDALTIDDLKELLAEREDTVILPLYLYDHSGLAMSTVPFAGRASHAEWDSGQVGYIYTNRDDIRRDFGEVTPETIKQAGAALESEVRQYDAYLRGDCWGYRTYMHGRETDACWGFLGDIDDIRRDIASHLAPGWDRLAERLEPYCQSAKEYLYDKTIA